MNMIRRIAAFLAALTESFVGGLFRSLFEALTGRDLQAERAEAQDAHERELAAQAEHDELEARHDETIAAAARQSEEMKALRAELRMMAERRERQAAIKRSHEEPSEAPEPDEVRPTWRKRRPDDEPEGGAPLCPVPV